jgi:hypothetical protein
MPINQEKDYLTLLDGLGKVGEATKGTKTCTDDRVLDAEGIVLKIFYHCSSAQYLSKGTFYPLLNKIFLEPASISILARAAYESFLVFNYIFASSDNQNVLDLRYWAWSLSGLLEKQDINPLTSKGREQLSKEYDVIESFRKKIQNNCIFQDLTEKQKKCILQNSGNWKIPIKNSDGHMKRRGWGDLAKSAGFSESTSRDLYRYLCQYAHSTSWCIDQIWSARSNEDKERLIGSPLSFLRIIMAFTITTYIKAFPKAKPVIENDPELRKAVHVWHYVGSTDKSEYKTDWDAKFKEFYK